MRDASAQAGTFGPVKLPPALLGLKFSLQSDNDTTEGVFTLYMNIVIKLK